MTLKRIAPFILLLMVVIYSTAGDSNSEVSKARKKAFNCPAYYQVMQNKSQLELQVPSVKLTIGKETQVVKPADETLRLGMKMRMLCEAFVSDPSMTEQTLFSQMQQLEDKQRQIENHFIITIGEHIHMSPEATVKVSPGKKDPR